jgi:hypothetical protein
VFGTRWRAAVGIGATLVATVCVAGTGSAETGDPVSVEASARHSFSSRTAEAKVHELWRSKSRWAGAYAADIVFSHPGKGQLVVLVKDHVAEIHDRVPADLKPFVTVARGGVADMAGSPTSDRGGWTGGNHIYSANSAGRTKYCTQGFAWRSWDTGAVLGSTARHCYQDAGPFVEWYHDGRHLGTRTQAGCCSDDVLFLRPAPGTVFNASIWVWLSGGGVQERVVTGAGVNLVDDTVAFYGMTSGGGIGKVIMRGPPLYEAWIYTDAHQVRAGDSGGPVYKTRSNGTVEARGTVSAATWQDKNGNGTFDPGTETTGMIFIDAYYTSSDMRASIYVP